MSTEGLLVGAFEGGAVSIEGFAEGTCEVAKAEGLKVGTFEGGIVDTTVGIALGALVGRRVGPEGFAVGFAVGFSKFGDFVGDDDMSL